MAIQTAPFGESTRQLPHNIEAEVACLGALLLKNALIDEVFSHVAADDFYDGRNRIIAEGLLELHGRSTQEPIDIISLQGHLEQTDRLEAAGGRGYISTIIDSVPTTANAVHYADIVHEKSQLRRIVDIGHQIIAFAGSSELSAQESLEKAQQELFALSKEQYQDYQRLEDIVRETIDRIERNYHNRGKAVGIETGFRDIDALIGGLHESNLVIIGGRPGMGKTALALSIVQNVAIDRTERTPVGIFSMEMSKIELCMRLLCAEARVPQEKLRKNALIESDWPRLIQAVDKIKDAPIMIDDTPSLSMHEIMAKARRMYQEGARMLVVDYLQLMGSIGTGMLSREQYIASVSRSLKQLARELAVPVIALTQLNRGAEGRTEKRPILSDIRESGSIEQDADIVIFIHRPAYYEPEREDIQNLAEVIVAKNRHGQQGRRDLFFDGQYTRFENYVRADAE